MTKRCKGGSALIVNLFTRTRKLGSYFALASLHYDLLMGTVLSQDDMKQDQEPSQI